MTRDPYTDLADRDRRADLDADYERQQNRRAVGIALSFVGILAILTVLACAGVVA